MVDVPGAAPTAPDQPKPFDADAAVASYLADPQPDAAPALKASVYSALDTKPDYEADLRKASAATGVPLAAARGDADYVKRQAQVLSLGLDGLVQSAPATTRFLSNPDNAKIAHDDTDVMAGLEKALTGPSPDTNWLGHSLASGLHTLAGTALILAQKGVDALSGSSEETDLADLGSSPDPAKRALAERMVQDKPKNLTERLMFGLEHGLSHASLGEFTAAGMSGAAANAALPPGAQNRVYATLDPNKSAFLSPSRLGSDLLQNAPTFMALALTAKVAGAQGVKAETEALAAGATAEQAAAARIAATASAMAKVGAISEGAIGYAQQSGQTTQQMAELTPDVLAKSKGYNTLIDAGFEPDVAKVILADSVANQAGVGAGVTDFATNLLGGHVLGHIIGEGGPWLSRILKGGATEGIQEAVQSPLEQVSQNLAMQRADPNQKLGTGALEQALQGLALGGLMGGSTAGIAGAGGRAHAQANSAQAAILNAISLENLAKLSEASKLRERDVTTFQGFVADAAKDGPVANVWLSADGLKQSGVDPIALAAASPAVASQINEARGTGGDMQIPVEQFATLSPELAQGLIPHLKTDPTGMSQAEAEHFMQNFGPELKANVEQVLAEQARTTEVQASSDKVRAKVLDQLTTANRFTHDVNSAYADLTAAFYTTQAQRLGMTPEALFESHPVNIAAQGVLDGSLSAHVEQPKESPRAAFERTLSSIQDALPDVPEDHTRLWRGNRPGETGQNPSYTSDAAGIALPFHESYGGDLSYVDVPNDELPEADRGGAPGVEFQLSPEQAATAKVVPPEAFEQSNGQPRGSYNPGTDLITLLRGADLSTFLHESGHFYLETLARLASDPTAPEGLREDMATALKFMGQGDMTPAEWLSQSLDDRREGHEKFARAFEQYLMEGKAPSQELRGLFQRLRAWLTTIYQQLKALRVELTPEVRAVFDRLIASEDQIAENEKAHSYGLMPDLQGHMTPDQWQEYQRLGAQATADAVDNLQTKSLRDMQWLSGARDRTIRQLQRDANTKRKAIRSEVEAEVNAEPINQARAFLKHGLLNGQEQEGPTKLSLPDLREMYGEAPTAIEETTGQKLLKVDYRKLGYGKYGMLAEDGLHPDHVAELFGFSSGDELVKTLLTAEPAAEKIHGITDQRMLERYGNLSDGPSIEKAADEALHNDARLRFVATEANALAKAVGKRKVLASAARSFAAEMIGRLAVREIKPSRYSAAEARAARGAEKAAKAGNLVEAATEKRNQLINGYAAKAAYDALDEVNKAVRYFARFDNAGTRKALSPEYRDQIDALLERFEFKPSTTLKEIARRKSLADWITSQEDKGFAPVIPDELRNEAFSKSYKDMTLDELRGLRDSVENIAHLGRLKNKLLAAQDARDFAGTVEDATAEVEASAIGKPRNKIETNQLADKIEGGIRGYAVAHRRFDSLIHRLAGLEDGTTLWNVLVRPKNAASDKEASMQEASLRAVHDLFTRTGVAMDRTRQKTFIPEIGTSLSLEGRIAVALNWGNQGNRARIMDGDNWSPAQVEAILKTLEPRHFEFVQGMWDHISSYKDEIAAKERRINGVEPEFVEPTPFTAEASDGSQVEMRGGYYPIDYDPDRSAKADEHDLADMVKRAFTGTTTRATTARGHLKARVDEVMNRPVKKTFSVAFSHLSDVIHDLSWHEYLIDANRLLGNETLANAIRVNAGPEILRSLKSAIRAMAAGDMPAQNAFESSVNYLRSGATVAGLGWNFLTALQQPLGIMNGAARIGPKWMGAGLKRWVGDALAMENTVKWVHAQSEFMRLRGEGLTLSRELYDVRGKLTVAASTDLLKATVGGKAAANIGTGLNAVEGSFYYFIGKMQMVADMPTWLGQYEKSMSLDADEKRAIAMADQAVRDSQGAGQIGDLAELQRGGPLMKIWTNFMSYFITVHNQLAESVERVQMKGVRALPLLASDVLLIGILPSVLGNSLRKLATGDDDWATWPADLAKGLMSDFFGMFVGLRDIASAVTDGKDAPAGMRILQNTVQLASQAKQGQADDAFWKALNSEAGILLHYPAAQVQKTVLGMQALASGQTHNPLAVLSGPPPKPH